MLKPVLLCHCIDILQVKCTSTVQSTVIPRSSSINHIQSILSAISIRFTTSIFVSRYRTDWCFCTPDWRAITLTQFTFSAAFVFLGVFVRVGFNVFLEVVAANKALVTSRASKPLLTWEYRKSQMIRLIRTGSRPIIIQRLKYLVRYVMDTIRVWRNISESATKLLGLRY